MTESPASGSPAASVEMSVIVWAPTRADGAAIAKVLTAGKIAHQLVDNMAEVCAGVVTGAGGVLLSEESLLAEPEPLIDAIGKQEVWSDLPVIVLSRSGQESHAMGEILPRLGNATVIERPVRTSTFVALIRSTQRARARQYDVRRHLSTQQKAEKEREEALASERAARGVAERASRVKDEFLATLSHELRTPLSAVLGWSRVLKSASKLPEDVMNGLSTIERNARVQAQIIEDLLDMSSILSGKVRLDVQPVDLSAVLEATVETVRPTADAKGVRLQVVLDPRAGPISGDPNRLQQIFWNLLSNAVKFTPREGRVMVKLARVNSHLEVEVADTGEGIDPSFLPHVFERFRQADASTARRHGGLGLGLSIVRQLVELHGGSISARSAGPGKGSTFRVMVPLMPIHEEILAGPGSREHPRHSTRVSDVDRLETVRLDAVSVLVVDDQLDSRALIQRILEDAGAHVVAAASADEAVAILTRERPRMLVSDIGMPQEDGYALIRRIRARNDDLARIPAVALTAYARTEDRIKAIRTGYHAHLAKPVEATELVAVIASLVKRSDSLSG